MMAEDLVHATNFLNHTPSTEQLVEALESPAPFKFRGIVRVAQSKVLLNIKFEFNSDKLTQDAVQTLSKLGKAMKHDELKNTLSKKFNIPKLATSI